MDDHNFWYWLLIGVHNIVGVISGRLPIYTYVGLGPFIYNFLAAAATPILFYIGSIFNLCWLALVLGILILAETARYVLAGYRTVIKMIPLP